MPLIATEVWVGSLIRRVELGGGFAAVLRKGDPRAGAVLIRTADYRAGDFRLYASAERGEGERVWMRPTRQTDEATLEAYVARAVAVDPDLWVVEIEASDGARFLTEPVDEG
ncbi:MAG TPA: DUF1491 family protein [Caulobacteraceae bacterium]|nr:DUF1491 family protein [Caulobacteraceae bacterium]